MEQQMPHRSNKGRLWQQTKLSSIPLAHLFLTFLSKVTVVVLKTSWSCEAKMKSVM